ncbi:MAG: TonB-dependent receptor [Alphaproteobacteria bacterium]|nr:TonB-dependent receptor [Alphaproteobacteria bacterium]MDE2111596.1 TonB-dependent receptor [Alphaproteobacteria bacterium]MDE2495732.1 TonB-dependent receptor [Alphaproteobacteria bacterium]
MARVHAKSKEIRKYLLLSAAFAASCALPARAQQIEEVVVTAQRYAQNEQDVPMSVTTLSNEQVSSIFESGQDIKALADHVPNLYAESSNGRVAPRFYIRGLGNTDFDLAASQPVSIIYDGVVMENAILKSSPLYDIKEVEVDRGPQGTLFGRNTTAGIIKFTSVKPSQDFSASATASYGELGTANVEVAAGGGLTDTISARISGLWQHRDNYIDNAYTGVNHALGGYDERAARLQVLWQPSDRLSVLVNVHGRSLNGTAAVFRANIIGPGNNHLNGNYVWNKVYFDGGFVSPTSQNNPQKYDGIGTNAEITYDFGPVKLTSISGYEETHGFSRGDIDGGNMVTGPGFIPFPSDTQDGLDYLHQYTQEVHLATNAGGPWFWQVGAFYFDTDYEDATYPFFVGPTFVRQTNISYALFGQTSYKVTDALTLTAGVRWTSDTKGMTANGPLVAPIVNPVRLSGDNVSWDFSADYAVDDNIKLYARVATGFRAPSIQGRNLAFGSGYSTARSETITSYEGGAKTELLDRRIRFNFDGFTYYLQHPQFSAIGGASNSVILENARAGLAYGLEADAEFAVTDNLLVTGGASWTHTEIRDPALKTAVCAQCTVLNPLDGAGNAYLNGNPFPQAPDYMLTLTARYDIPLANGGELFAYTDWWLQGYTDFFLYKSAEFHTNGNYEGGLKIGYDFPDKVFELAAYARNITDRANLQGGIDFNNNTGFVGDPRVIGIELSAHVQ